VMTLGERRDAFLQTIARLTAERAAARDIVASLRASDTDVWDWEIPEHWRTAGFVQELTSTASDTLESNPRESLACAQLGLAIATSIPTGTYPSPVQAQIEGAAWKEIGTAHRYLSEYDAAFRAYDAAQRAYRTVDSLQHDDAVIDFARAIVLSDVGRYDEALELLASVEPMLRGFEDRGRIVKVRLLVGTIYFQQQRLEDAREVYRRTLTEIPFDDLHTRAMLYSNLGQVTAEIGDVSNAVLLLNDARQLLAALEMEAEVARTEWALGRILLQTGEHAKAAAMFEKVRKIFLSKTMVEEAGLAGLDIADARIASGRQSDARSVIENVVAEFTSANLNQRAITALAYLRDVLPTASKPERAVRHVRQYLEDLRSEPARLFLPLPE
jgi:tetratricopeptide (TPR) repeat protein